MNAFRIYKRRLPHWRVEGATYFVTWRVASEFGDLRPEERDRVVDALRHFAGARYGLPTFVVMNDHVHALLRPLGTHKLEDIVHSLKSFTAKQIRKQNRVGDKVWQDEYFDRVVRDQGEFQEKAAYILNNPLKRWPEWEDYPWVGFEGDGVGDA